MYNSMIINKGSFYWVILYWSLLYTKRVFFLQLPGFLCFCVFISARKISFFVASAIVLFDSSKIWKVNFCIIMQYKYFFLRVVENILCAFSEIFNRLPRNLNLIIWTLSRHIITIIHKITVLQQINIFQLWPGCNSLYTSFLGYGHVLKVNAHQRWLEICSLLISMGF